MKPRREYQQAFTFVEVLVAVSLMVIGFLGVYSSMYASALLRETANETNIAMFRAQTTAEYVFCLPFDQITTQLPAGSAVNITDLMDANTDNDFVLPGEQVTITYPNGTAADPLHFVVTIVWTSRLGTQRTEVIECARAR